VISLRDSKFLVGPLPPTSLTLRLSSLDLSGCSQLSGTIPPSWRLMVSLATLDIRSTALRFDPSDTAASQGLMAVSSLFAQAHRESSSNSCRCPSLTSRERPGALNVRFDPSLYDWSLCVCNDGDAGRDGLCQPCPFGASCANGSSLLTKEGFWCNATAYALGHEVSCHSCPSNYCCSKACPVREQCRGNRHGVLCGSCRPGSAVGLGTTSCVDDTQGCNAVLWVVPLVVVVTGAFAIRTVGRSVGRLYADLLRTENTAHYSLQLLWAVDILVYFYQVAPLSAGASVARSSSVVLGFVASALNLDADALADDDGGGICLVPGLTTAAKIALAPSVVVALMAWAAVLTVVTRVFLAVRRHRLNETKEGGWCGPYEAHKVVVITALQLGYSTALKSAFRLVHCVHINGSLLLWAEASIECYRPWQQLAMGLAAALSLFPIALGVWIHRQVARNEPSRLVGTGVFYALVSPFRPGCQCWAALLFGLRFAFVAAYTLVVTPMHRAMFLVALSIASLSLTAYFRPHRTMALNSGDLLLQMTTAFVAAVGMVCPSMTLAHGLSTPLCG